MLRSAHSWQWWWQWRLRMDVRISVLCMHRVLCMNVSIQFCLNMFVGNENCISLLWVLILTHCSKQWNDLPCMHGEHSKASTVSKSRCIGSNFNKRLQKQNFLARTCVAKCIHERKSKTAATTTTMDNQSQANADNKHDRHRSPQTIMGEHTEQQPKKWLHNWQGKKESNR